MIDEIEVNCVDEKTWCGTPISSAEGRDVSRSRQRFDGESLEGSAEAMEVFVVAGGDERWSVVRSSEEPEHVAERG